MDVATRIVVLRNGTLAWTGGTDIAPQKLVEAMGGEAEAALRSQHERATLHKNKVLTVGGDVVAPLGRELEFWTGEIVGLAGLEGSGQKEFLHRVFAASDRPDPEVRLTQSASFVSGRSPAGRSISVLERVPEHGHRPRGAAFCLHALRGRDR